MNDPLAHGDLPYFPQEQVDAVLKVLDEMGILEPFPCGHGWYPTQFAFALYATLCSWFDQQRTFEAGHFIKTQCTQCLMYSPVTISTG